MTNSTQINQLWRPEDVDFLFRSYQIFEQKLVEILRVLPLTTENEKSWSSELVNLFLDICGLIDSISRHTVGQGKNQNDSVQVKNAEGETISKEIHWLNMTDFKINFLSADNITDARTVIYVYPLKIILPYENYQTSDGWWNIYNSLKHDRIANYKKADLSNTLRALAAVFLILVRYKNDEFTKALLRYGMLETDYVPEAVHEARLTEPYHFWYDSNLFGTPEEFNNIPSDDVSQINHLRASRKLRIYIGRFNP